MVETPTDDLLLIQTTPNILPKGFVKHTPFNSKIRMPHLSALFLPERKSTGLKGVNQLYYILSRTYWIAFSTIFCGSGLNVALTRLANMALMDNA